MKGTFSVIGRIFFICLLVALSACSSAEEKKAEHFQKGKAYLAEGQDKAAVLEFRNAIKIDPKYAEARYQLGIAYLRTGEPQKAFGELERAASLDPDNLDALLKTAELFFLSKKIDDSRARTEKILARDGNNVDALALLANIELASGQPDRAQELIARALALRPEMDRLYLVQASIAAAKQDAAGAEQALQKALEIDDKKMANHQALVAHYVSQRETGKAVEQLRAMAAAFPDAVQPHLELARLQEAQGLLNEAEASIKTAIGLNKEPEALYVMLGNFYRDHQRAGEAEETYREALTRAENKNDVKAVLADFYFTQGNFASAKEMADAILAENGKHGAAGLVRAKLLVRDRNEQQALPILDQLTQEYPRWAEPFFYKAVVHLARHEVELAQQAAAESVKINGSDDKSRALLAHLYLMRGELDLARQEAAIALKLKPSNLQAVLVLGKTLLAAKDYDKASQLFNRLGEALPENAEVLHLKGVTHLARREEEQAKAVFEKLLALQPADTSALAALAAIAEKRRRGAGLELVRRQIEIVPDAAKHHLLLGDLLLRIDKVEEALAAFRKVQQLVPDNPRPYVMVATILRKANRAEEAIKEYRVLLERQPELIQARMGLATLLEQTGDAAGAKEAYRKILAQEARFAPAANNLAWLLASEKDGDMGEALRLAMLAKEQQPSDPHVTDTLGWVHYRRGSHTLAAVQFSEALAVVPEQPTIRYHLALALQAGGDTARALGELEQVLARPDYFPERPAAETLLASWRQQLVDGAR